METRSPAGSGVEQLIDRLRAQGVEAGRQQADALIDDARTQAQATLADASQKAEMLLRQGREEVDRLRQAGEAALKLAVRDAALKLREEIFDRLANELREIVGKKLADESFLEKVILEVAGSLPDQEGAGVLPNHPATVDELRAKPDELENGPLSHLAARLAHQVAEKGIVLIPPANGQPGVHIELAGGDVRLEATEEAVSRLLLRHLMPRFRALMEGMVS